MISPELKLIIDQAPLRQRQAIGSLPGSNDVQIRSGQVLELIGPHSQGWAVRLFASIPNARVGWITGQALDLCPMALAQSGLPLSRFLFLDQVELKTGFSKITAFIKSGLFPLVVFDQNFFLENIDVNLRKLQLIAEEHGTVLIMRSLVPTHSFSVNIQVDTRLGQSGQLIKVKGGMRGNSSS